MLTQITIRAIVILGWNSWNHYHSDINETIIRKTADILVATGLAAAGYQYGVFSIQY
jgi:hypothetical protein